MAVSAGDNHTVGLKADGTVVAVGKNEDGQCNVSDWTDIVSIAAGYDVTIGLKSDGTVVKTGRKSDVDDWTDIVAITTGYYHTVGLKADGTLVVTGSNKFGQFADIRSWADSELLK